MTLKLEGTILRSFVFGFSIVIVLALMSATSLSGNNMAYISVAKVYAIGNNVSSMDNNTGTNASTTGMTNATDNANVNASGNVSGTTASLIGGGSTLKVIKPGPFIIKGNATSPIVVGGVNGGSFNKLRWS